MHSYGETQNNLESTHTLRHNSCITTYLSSQKTSQKDKQDMRDTTGVASMNSYKRFYGSLQMYVLALADQQERINISSVQTRDEVWRASQERWMMGVDGENVNQGDMGQ